MDLYYKTSLQCSKITTQLYSTSFSAGISMLNRDYRDGIFAIYGFVRFADEIVDTFYEYNRKHLLKKFREETYAAIEDQISTNPILYSFQWAVNTYSIRLELIDAFLESMEMDLHKTEYTKKEYEKYIYGSAEVVGLMCLHVFCQKCQNEYSKMEYPAKKLGQAFQKVNFLRDIKDDYVSRKRIYFPGINFKHFTVEEKQKIEEDIRENLKEAYKGIQKLPGEVRLGVYVAYIYFKKLFQKIEKLPPDTLLGKRIRVNNMAKVLLLINAYLRFKINSI